MDRYLNHINAHIILKNIVLFTRLKYSFGKNDNKIPKLLTFLDSFIDSLKDPTLKLLLVASVFSLIFSFFSEN